MTKIPKYSGIVKPAGDVTETPYKYNGGYNYTEGDSCPNSPKYSIVVDYLSLTLTGFLFHSSKEAPEVLNFGAVELLKMEGGTRHYTYRYKVKLNGEDFGILLTVPREGGALSSNRPDYNEFKLSNHVLYRQGWASDVCNCVASMELEFYHITRLDIALDGYKWLDVFDRYKAREIRPLGRAKMTSHTSKGTDGFHVLDGVDWGSRSSEKYLTVYKVGKRVEADNKGYRAKFWEANGLTDIDNVQRLELKLKAKALKRLETSNGEPITKLENLLSELQSSPFLSGIMKAHFKGWFEWVVPDERQANTSRLARAQVIDWGVLDALKIKRIPTTKKPNRVWAAKRCASALLDYNSENFLSEYIAKYLKGIGRHVSPSELSDMPRQIAYAVAQHHEVGGWLQRRDPVA
jgi:hypothetical protein